MTRLNRHQKGGDRSRPGRDFREIPGTGGGRRVDANPGGNRAARRAEQRRAGRAVDLLIVDDPVRDWPVDPYAALVGVQLRPTGRGGVAAVCLADHGQGGPEILMVDSPGKPCDLGDLASAAAEHRATHRGDGESLCTCPTYPSGGATRREDDPGCPEHGWVAQLADKARRFDVMATGLFFRLGGEGGHIDPDAVHAAVSAALPACYAALSQAETRCRFHGDRPTDLDARGVPRCESCRQPARVRAALAALKALSPTDVWDEVNR